MSESLAMRVAHHATVDGEKQALIFLGDDGLPVETLTYAELDRAMRGVAALLCDRGIPGDRVMLMHLPGLRFVVDFLGSLAAGMVAVPVYPPLGHREIRTAELVAARTKPAVLLTNLGSAAAELAVGAAVLATDEQDLSLLLERPVGVSPDDLALIQFTSGSTGAPKGAMISHGNIADNQRRIQATFGQRADSVIVSWLPVYHDMGLIGSLLHSLYLGASCVLMSPLSFVQRPMLWLEAIGRYGGTITAAPNFAYALCARRASETGVAPIRLDTLEVAICGGEPVRPETVDEFSKRFASCGFRAGAFCASYGMAEATLLVCGAGRGEGPRIDQHRLNGRQVSFVSCGRVGEDVRIVDSLGSAVASGMEGEIWLKSASVARGYWEDPTATAETFRATLIGEDGFYLRSGDLGLVADEHLYITGRQKDLIIVRGRNHHPHDIEVTAEQAAPDLRPGCLAAFQVDDAVILAAETRGKVDAELVAEAIRAAVSRDHGLWISEIVLTEKGTIPKTSSGKIRRRGARDSYLERRSTTSTEVGGAASPVGSDARIQRLQGILEHVLADANVHLHASLSVDEPVVGFGVDSLVAVSFQYEVERTLGLRISLDAILGGASLRELASSSSAARSAEGGTDADHADEPAPHRLTLGQQTLWLASRLRPMAAPLTIARAMWLPENLPLTTLNAALQAVVSRHDALRTRVVDRRGSPEPSVEPTEPIEVACFDVVADDVQREVDRWCGRRFELSAELPVRFAVFRTDAGQRIFAFAVDHTAADLWSLTIVLDDLRRSLMSEAPTPAGALEMRAVAAQEAAFLRSPQADALRAAWRQALAGLEPDLDLPFDRHLAGASSGRGFTVTTSLGPESRTQVRQLASTLGVTPAAVGLAVFRLLLAKLGRNADCAIGVPTARRSDSRLQRTVGYLVNVLPIRTQVHGSESFQELVRHCASALVEGVARGDLPVSEINQVFSRANGGHSAELVRVMYGHLVDVPGATSVTGLAMEANADVELSPGLVLRPYPLTEQTVAADFEVTTGEVGGEWILRLGASADRFERTTVAVLCAAMLGLFRQALARPNALVSELCMLDERAQAELETITVGDGPQPEHPSLVAQFIASVEAHADAPALIHGGLRWSYAELCDRARDAADRMRSAIGGRRDELTLIGLILEPGPEFVAGLLGAWWLGLGVIPISSDIPEARARQMLADGGAVAVCAQRTTAERAGSIVSGLPIVMVPDGATPLVRIPALPAPTTTGASVAYVIYTSGTTGTPKGVPITHANVAPLLRWQKDKFRLGPGERLAQTLSLSFDFGLQEVMTGVLFGATLCIPTAAERWSATDYAAFVNRDAITILSATPTFAVQLVVRGLSLPSVTTVILGGEILSATALRAIARVFPSATTFVNGYGPTEASINCSMQFWGRAPLELDEIAALPVGRPTGRSAVAVVDALGQFMPIGIRGEVIVGGPGVSSGYLGRQRDVTGQFIDGPWRTPMPAYRTGDVGWLDQTGALTITGRRDDQIKLRGYRIEPAEIEQLLRAHSSVAAACVVSTRSEHAKRLKSFVVLNEQASAPTAEDLRQYLASKLPSAVIPSVTVLEALPRLASGKVDRNILVNLSDETSRPAGRPYQIEERIAAIWAEEIGVERVGTTQNFFEAGGYSLLVGPLAARIEETFHLSSFPLSLIFEHPTVSEQASLVASMLANNPSDVRSTTARRRLRGRQAIRF